MKYFVSFFLLLVTTASLKGQSFSINTDGSTANTSALLDVKSATKGILIPRLSKTEKNSIVTPATGLLIFQNAPDSIGFHYYDGSKWIWMLGSNNVDSVAWKTNGNIGTNTTNKFIGTTDNVPLSFRQNNKWVGRLDATTKNYFLGAGSGITTIGNNNVAIGDSTLTLNISGSKNIGIGSKSLYKINNALNVIGIGTSALGNNTAPDGTVAIGDSTGFNTFGSEAVFIGFKAARSVTNSDGYRAVVIGSLAGDSSVANWSTVIGNTAGRKNKTLGNTFVGSAAGENTTTGIVTAVGDNAAISNVSGSLTAIGAKAGFLNTTGVGNSFIGEYAGFNNSSGDANTLLGDFSGYSNTLGYYNTFLGKSSGINNLTGFNNTILGAYADLGSTFLNNATAIGANARVDVSNAMVLGSIIGIKGATASTNVGIGTTAPLTSLDVRGGIRTMYSGSAIRPVIAGLQLVGIPISPALPAGWDFTNTMVIVTIVDGTTGTIYQTKLVSATQINVDMNGNFGGATRFNYIIFKL